MSDLIDRKAAIDAIKREQSLDERPITEIRWFYFGLEKAQEVLREIPSAQPEIIRCKDCLMHGVCRFEQGLGMDGYCSQAERRTDG